MADTWQLAPLLELRTTARDEARRVLGEAVQAHREAEEMVEAATVAIGDHDRDLAASRDAHEARMATSIDLFAVRRFDDYVSAMNVERANLEKKLAQARAAEADASKVVEVRRAALAEAEKEVKAIEKHREKWEAEREVVARRRQADAMDEIAITRWNKEKS